MFGKRQQLGDPGASYQPEVSLPVPLGVLLWIPMLSSMGFPLVCLSDRFAQIAAETPTRWPLGVGH